METIACLALLCGLFALLLLRVPYGFDWTDEAYYTVLPYRFCLGDRPLVDTWEVHQFSGLLSLPFLQAYLLVRGGDMTGVMLYFRYVLVCVQFLLSVYAFFVLRRRMGALPGALAAGLILMHVHYGLNGFSYNAMAPLCCMMSALLSIDALDKRDSAHSRAKAALAGVFYACSVQAYPYFVLSVPVYAAFWWLQLRFARKRSGAAQPRMAAWFVLGVLVVAAAVLARLLTQAGPAQLISGVKGMLGDPDHTGESALRVLLQYGNAIRVLFGPAFTGALLLLGWSVAACYRKNAAARQTMVRAGYAACVVLLLVAVIWVAQYDYPHAHKINLAAGIPVLLAPSVYFLSGRKRDASMLLFFLGIALSVSVQLGSNTRIRSSSGMLLPASVGALAYLFRYAGEAFDSRAQIRWLRGALTAACACALLLTTGLRMVTVYRDAPLQALDTRLADGPAAGVVTTKQNAADYAAVYDDLTRYAPAQGTLLVTNLLPVAYLMTPLAPATPSTFNMTVDAPWLELYYAQNPARVPDCIYAADARIGQGNDLSLTRTATLQKRTGRAYASRTLTGGTLFTCTAP